MVDVRRATGTADFYPRSPCGERPAGSAHDAARLAHFYPRSPCGERLRHGRQPNPPPLNFYPRSPCGERQTGADTAASNASISIHALLAESDLT